MSAVATAIAVGSIGSAVISSNAAKKAAAQVSNLQYQPIDLEKLQAQAQNFAEQNIAKSIALEQQYMPQVSAARFGLQTQIAQDLSRGGNLPLDVANQVTRASMGQAARGGFGAGPLTAAQLGLTAFDLRQQAQNRAGALLAVSPLPTAGIDPGSLASAAIGQNQQQNQFNLSKAGAQANLIQTQGNIASSTLGSLAGIGGNLAAARYGGYGAPGGITQAPALSSGAVNPFLASAGSNLLGSTGGNITFGTVSRPGP